MIEKVSILGKPYQVKEVPDHALVATRIGHCDTRASVLTVADSLADDQKRETLLHEALHALDSGLATGLTEQQVAALSSGLYALAQEDPGAVRYMLGLDKEEKPSTAAQEWAERKNGRFADVIEDAQEMIARERRERFDG